MTTGGICSATRRRRDASLRALRAPAFCILLFAAACGGPSAAPHRLSPSGVTLGGTPCFLPLPALHASFGGLECRLDDAGIGTCRIPPREIRRNGLRGMREVDFAIGAGMV